LVFNLVVLGLLWRLRGVFKTDGLLFLTYAGVYASGRFLLTFFRAEQVAFWGLQQAQVVALVILPLVLVLLIWRLRAASGREGDAGTGQAAQRAA
jgi:phosphatidylglycerol:prolipoprotein diacylglycerol transferase